MIKVSILQRDGQAALVEWLDRDGSHRGILPFAVLQEEEHEMFATEEALQQAVPYGYLWETLPLGCVGAEQVAATLRAHGIWTLQDAKNRIAVVRAAIQAAYKQDLEQLFSLIRNAD